MKKLENQWKKPLVKKEPNTMSNTDKMLTNFQKSTERLTLKRAVVAIIKPLEVKDRLELLQEIKDIYQSELDVYGESK